MSHRLIFVIDTDHDFGGDMSEAAIWMEAHLAKSKFEIDVTAYASVEDVLLDALQRQGAFEPGDAKRPTGEP